MAGTISTTVEMTGSFLTAGPLIQAQVDALITVTGEAVRQGAADRSPVDTGRLQSGWTFINEGNQSGSVFNDVEYCVYVELGTRFMSSHPMLFPAVDAARPAFEAALREIVGS